MKKIRNLFLSFSILFILPSCPSQTIKINIFNKYNIQTVIVESEEGEYIVLGDTKTIYRLKKNRALYITIEDSLIAIRSINNNIGRFKKIVIKKEKSIFNNDNKQNIIKVTPLPPELEAKKYDDNIEISIAKSSLLIINNIEFSNYIAGVIEAEGGSKAPYEFYKAQALICRTYALNNIDRHKDEGFNLCDNTHCQAYKQRCTYNDSIVMAAKATQNLVITDSNGELIGAVFHANCGGITANSEDVWSGKRSYLKSVKDPYCSWSWQARWKKTISLIRWKEYLIKNGFPSEQLTNSNITFNQLSRKTFYTINSNSLRLSKIRNDWRLKSNFFSLQIEGNNAILNGRGYGHGIGMCQEGAMSMAKKGFSFTDIIKFYYTDVKIIKTNESKPSIKSEIKKIINGEENQTNDFTSIKEFN